MNFRMHEDSLNLSAPTRDIEYVAAYSFCCPVNPDKAKATCDDGLLTIEIPFKDPMEHAVGIPIG